MKIILTMFVTSDSQNELFDVVNKDDRVVGQATRAEVHQNKSLIHRSIGVAVFNKRGEIFLQQRSAGKDTDPLLWTISCSGHVLSGDGYLTTVIREFKEELGLDLAKSVSIGPACKYLCRAPNETEMVMLYKAELPIQFTSGESRPLRQRRIGLPPPRWSKLPFKLNKEEIIQGKFFTRKELKKAIKMGEIELSFMGKVALEKLEWI